MPEALAVSDHSIKSTDLIRSSIAPFLITTETSGILKLQEDLQINYYDGVHLESNGLKKLITRKKNSAASNEDIARFLSKRTITVVPCYQEEQTIGQVVDYLNFRHDIKKRQQNPNVLVVIAPPPPGQPYDKSAEIAEKEGARVIFQRDIFHTGFDPELLHAFGIPDLTQLRGKGLTVAAGESYIIYANAPGGPDLNNISFVNHHDSDIKYPFKFDVLGYLAAFAKDHTDQFLHIRAARGGRNNEPIHEIIKSLPVWAGELGQQIYNYLHRLKWPLSGQIMEGIEGVIYNPRATGYAIEMASHLGTSALLKDRALNPTEKRSAQIEIPTPCIDGGNNHQKEQIIESLINTFFIHAVKLGVEREKHPIRFNPEDYAELNRRLQTIRDDYFIPIEPGPNRAIAVKQDYAVPPFALLEEKMAIKPDALKNLAQKQFGKRYLSHAV